MAFLISDYFLLQVETGPLSKQSASTSANESEEEEEVVEVGSYEETEEILEQEIEIGSEEDIEVASEEGVEVISDFDEETEVGDVSDINSRSTFTYK